MPVVYDYYHGYPEMFFILRCSSWEVLELHYIIRLGILTPKQEHIVILQTDGIYTKWDTYFLPVGGPQWCFSFVAILRPVSHRHS